MSQEPKPPGLPGEPWSEPPDPHRASAMMLRVTQANQAQLSAMADQKANIVLGTSVLGLTLLLGRLQDGLTPSLAVLAVFILASAFFALLTVMPSLPKSSRVDPRSPGFNPLFFGFFARMELDDYRKHMHGIMDDVDAIQDTILRDIHQAGTVLYREKFRYLAYSYRLLLAGLVLGIASAGVEFLLGR